MVHKHKFISFEKSSNMYKVHIAEKKSNEYKCLFIKRFETLDEAIRARDDFFNNSEDKRYKGISYHKRNKKWISTISLKSKRIILGSHNTQEEAKDFRNKVLTDLMN